MIFFMAQHAGNSECDLIILQQISILSSKLTAGTSQQLGGRLPLLSAKPWPAKLHRPLASTKLYCTITAVYVWLGKQSKRAASASTILETSVTEYLKLHSKNTVCVVHTNNCIITCICYFSTTFGCLTAYIFPQITPVWGEAGSSKVLHRNTFVYSRHKELQCTYGHQLTVSKQRGD